VNAAVRNLHVPDYLILPFGHAVKSDLQKIMLSAVSADGLYFSTDVPVIFIRKSDKRPLCVGDFERIFGKFPDSCSSYLDADSDQAMLDYMCTTLKSHNPNMTQWENMFLDLYFGTLKALSADTRDSFKAVLDADDEINFPAMFPYKSPTDVWRALLPIPELQLYVQDPLAGTVSYQPDNNFRVDYGFWDGES
jgi:hypothetical protein